MRINPFNPQIPARPQFFVGREAELDQFERWLLQTTNGSPMNMSITGNRGMGKTSLLVKMEQIAKNHGCLVFRMSNYENNIQNCKGVGQGFLLSHVPPPFTQGQVRIAEVGREN
ncbi:MAG TPA: ATP-binding protein [Candidatus Diapherotrites archaeon]|uniref:ATP-binding protein n=1 Tax=Candidatus Iainarchaeum sp. TaxID=3101447 RepID=A0A7J4JE79_9ARCH|nr:ATP-binding protein [Candidatus Diapherotrites archaeon]HIH16072.1 ATP-binding protein [Candidatus Diapherotrites archaeon]